MAEKRRLTLVHYIIYGAIMTTMVFVFLGQEFIPGAEASPDMTMNLVMAGSLVGAIAGGIFGKKKLSETPKDESSD